MELLINKQDVASILQVGIGVSDKDFDVHIREAQEFDLRKNIDCDEFFLKLIDEKETDPYKKVFYQTEYTYDNRKYYHLGIKTALSYFTYSRFIHDSNVVSTTHGFQMKKNPSSEPISLEERRNFYYHYKGLGSSVLGDVMTYVHRFQDLYPEYKNCHSCVPVQRSGGFKTKVIQ